MTSIMRHLRTEVQISFYQAHFNFRVVGLNYCLAWTRRAPQALLLRQEEHVRSINLKLKACICFRRKLARWQTVTSD